MTISIAFSGAMFAWPYQAGVAAYVQDHDLLDDHSRIYGTSSGSAVAMMLAMGLDIARVAFPLALDANARAGWFRPSSVIPTYIAAFAPILPVDAALRATGRLFVAITKLPLFRRTHVCEYTTGADVLDALAGSMALPGITVRVAHRSERHGWCIDGGPVANRDDRPGARTIRVGVGPLPGDDIMPSRRIGLRERSQFASRADREAMFQLGYADARSHLG